MSAYCALGIGGEIERQFHFYFHRVFRWCLLANSSVQQVVGTGGISGLQKLRIHLSQKFSSWKGVSRFFRPLLTLSYKLLALVHSQSLHQEPVDGREVVVAAIL